MKSQSKAGFTLIELLVVIAIIAILAAILFPVFAKAREKARQTTCLSDMKQLGLGFLQYENDYDETPPCGVYLFGAGGSGWAGQIYTYVKSTAVYRCPDDDKGTGTFSSYGLNANMGTGAAYPFSALPISRYNAVAKTVLLFEVSGSVAGTAANPTATYDITQPNEGPNGQFGGSPFGVGLATNNSPNGAGAFSACTNPALLYATGYLGGEDPGAFSCHWTSTTGRHSDGSNFLMADGHAKWMRGAAVSPGINVQNAVETGPQTNNQYAAGSANPGFAATFSIY